MKEAEHAQEPILGGADRRDSRDGRVGQKVADICREHGISGGTFYRWKAKYGGLDVSELRRLKRLEDENRRLKQLVAELSLDVAMLKDVASKKW